MLILENLTCRPTKGEVYLVRCVWQEFTGLRDWWPVWAEAKRDNFNHLGELRQSDLHYHVDPRFLSDRQIDHLEQVQREIDEREDTLPMERRVLGVMRLSSHRPWVRYTMSVGMKVKAHAGLLAPDAPVEHRPLECRGDSIEWDVPARDEYWPLKPITGAGRVQPAVMIEGRPRCPHNGMDLSTIWDGNSETVRCPLHGLEVDMHKCPRSPEKRASA